MSLISSFVANVEWGLRASEAEYKAARIAEEVHEITQEIADFKEYISDEEDFGDGDIYEDLRYRLEDHLYTGNVPNERKAEVLNAIRDLKRQQRTEARTKSRSHEAELKQLHERENQLQNELKAAEVEVKMSQNQGESFKKMQDNAIKRLTIQV